VYHSFVTIFKIYGQNYLFEIFFLWIPHKTSCKRCCSMYLVPFLRYEGTERDKCPKSFIFISSLILIG
jgi:hypothetical protein